MLIYNADFSKIAYELEDGEATSTWPRGVPFYQIDKKLEKTLRNSSN